MQDDNTGVQAPDVRDEGVSSSYPEDTASGAVTVEPKAEVPPPVATGGGKGGGPPVTGSGGGDDGGDDEEDGMLRMSFLEHLEELRSRILKALAGVGVAFVLSLVFANEMWTIVAAPAMQALKSLGFQDKLVQITPMETFSTVWVKLPMLASIFLASPWIVYQVWAFIAPGLYRKERRWAAPFVICSAGLFITGGLFAYFVAFRFGLTFLLGIGRDIHIQPMVSITEYFDLFVNVMLGIGLVFEMPVLIFFLTLLRIVTPSFLISHSRYAILGICIIAAVVTPTPDVFNMMLFAVPMCLLFYIGVFAGYLLVLHREHRRFPWAKVLPWVAIVMAILGAAGWYFGTKYGYHFIGHWPFVTR